MRAMRTCAKKKECVNAPVGPFTTFTHYADGMSAAPQMRMMRSLRSGTGGVAQFHVNVDFQKPYPTNATVYGVSSPGGTTYVDDMITRDGYMDYTSIWSSNIIHVTTLDPKPAFCTNVAGVFIIKMKCDDHATISVGGISVHNSWPNREFAKAWKVIEANTTNAVSITWDSSDGGKWNLDYECYFYPAKFRPPCPEDDDCECGCDRAFNAYNGSVSIRQPFGETPNVPSLPRGSLRIREVEPSSRLASPECLYYDHPMERRVRVSKGASSTISVPNGEEIVYKNGRPHGYSAGLDSSLSVDAAGRLVERLPGGLLVVYGANGVPVALKPEHCREIAVAELGISVACDSQGAISSIASASDGTMSVARTSSSSFNVTWTDATNGYVKTFMFSQPSSNIFELNEFVNSSMNTTYRWEYSEEERCWTFVNDYGKADARTESRTAVWNDEARTWTKTQVWYDSDGTPGETETKVYTANGYYPKLSRIERGGETVYQAAHGATGRAGTTTNETGLATENVHDRYGRRVKSSQIVKGGLVETETTSYKPVSSGGFVDFRPVRTIRTLDGIEIERTAWLYETNRTTTTRTVDGVTRTSFAEYDGLGREVLYVSEDGRATRRTYSTDLPVGACTETSETGVFSNGAFSLVDGKSERTVSERNAFGDEIRTERFALVGGEWHSLSFETKTYNAKHQVVSTQYSNGKSSSAAWICTGPLWQVGTDGIAITNIYDGTKSLVSSTRYSPLGAVTTEYVRDCRDRAVQESESAPGVETRTTTRTYDARGRLSSVTDEQGRTTTYAYTADNRTTTETLPSGATRITTVNPDGSIASVTGTAQAAEFYSYGVTEDGLEWTQVNYLSPDGARWRRTYVNGFGETVSEEWPGFGELAQRRRDAEYDSKGRLVRVEETGKPIETRAYDSFGEVTNITYAVDDEWRRIASDTTNALIDNEIWRVSSRTVFCSDPSIAPLVTTNMTQVSGLSLTNESRNVSIDIRGNASESWSEFAPAMSKRISYARIPTATNIALEESIDGATVRSVSHSAVTNAVVFDAYRRETVRTDGRGNATTNAYDTLGRLASVTDPLGATTRYAYDAVGNLVAVTNALGNAVVYEYDLRGNKTYEGGATYPVRYTYDNFNVMTNMTTYRNESLQSGDTTTWLYDIGSGAMTNKVYADGSTIAYTHTSDGLLLRETKPSGAWKENVYDAARQIIGVVSSDGAQDASMQRDEFGRVMTESNSVAFAEYSLDDCWGATNETQTVDGVSVSFERGFDAYGRIERFTRVGGDESIFDYAPHGAISTVSNGNVAVEYAFTGDALDAGYALAVQGGLDFSREVFRHGYLRSCIVAVSNHCGNASQWLEYSYDVLQRPVSRNADSFGYNVRGEVVFSRRDAENAEETCSYDDIGNLVFNTFGAITNIYFSNSRNQYTSNLCASASLREVNYDLDGNMTRHGEWTYAYDSGNRLVSVASNGITVVTMSYDTQGRRVKKVAADGTHRYFYDGWLLVYEHVVRPNNTTNEIEYVWGKDVSGTRGGAAGIGGLLYQKRDGAIYVPWYDAYGNIIGYRDVQGNVVASYTYDAFGNIISQSGAMIDVFAFRFSTKYFDADCGLYYYGYRHYKPLIMRWLTEDPLEENGWVNLYAFNSNSPVHVVDILGLKPQTQCQKNGVLIELLFNGLTLSGSGFSTAAASGRPIAVNITSWVSIEKILGSPAFGGIYTEYTFDYSAKRQQIKNEGPTPEGTYWIEVNEKRSARTSIYSHVIKRKAWGDFSWSLHPDESTQTFGRGGFFIHGGFNWGSAGCIDIKEGDAKLNEFLSGLCDCYIPVKVNYAVKQNKLSEREITWHYTIAPYGVPFIR